MPGHSQFRRSLPLAQTVIAISFGGWGLWIRNAELSRPFVGSLTDWHSTARFHVWPWPFKFAAILNLPALLTAGVLSLPLDFLRIRVLAWASVIPDVLCVYLLWYWLGSRIDKSLIVKNHPRGERQVWLCILLFMLLSAAGASVDQFVGTYTTWVLSGIGIWLLVISVISNLAPRIAKPAPSGYTGL